MRKPASRVLSFCFGGTLYGLIELIFRGHTHWSMLLAGGTAFLVLGTIRRMLGAGRFLLKCLLGAAFITAVEFAFGCIFNLTLNMSVWDYSDHRLNLLGQICPTFTALWLLLCVPGLPLCGFICDSLAGKTHE